MNGAAGQFLILIALVAAMWFILIRPQQQRAKQHTETVRSLAEGVRVVTIGGLVGEIVELNAETVILATGDGSELEFVRDSIAKVLKDDELLPPGEPDEEPEADEADEPPIAGDEPPVADGPDAEK